jgi:hypothetical protein
MFNFFISFSRTRSFKEGCILYFAHLLAGLLFSLALTYGLYLASPFNINMQMYFGNLGALIYVSILILRVMKFKKWDFKNSLGAILGTIFSIYGGLLFGLIPAVFLMVRKQTRS